MSEAKPHKSAKDHGSAPTQATKKTKQINTEHAQAGRPDSSDKEIIERLKLSKLDTVFLFTFTVTTIALTYLSTLITTLGPVLPLLVISFSIYPYFLGIWQGMIKEDIPARIFAWNYLITQFTILVAILIFTPLALTLVPLTNILNSLGAHVNLLVSGFVSAIVAMLFPIYVYKRVSKGIKRAFTNALTISKPKASNLALKKANSKYSKPTIVLNPLTMTIEFFALQDYLMATEAFTENIVPPYPLMVILTYVVLAYYTYQSVRPRRPKKTSKKPKLDIRSSQQKGRKIDGNRETARRNHSPNNKKSNENA